jgi:hypothetical protein
MLLQMNSTKILPVALNVFVSPEENTLQKRTICKSAQEKGRRAV